MDNTLLALSCTGPHIDCSYSNHGDHTLQADVSPADLISSESGNQVTSVVMENAVIPRDFREAILDSASPDEPLHVDSPCLITDPSAQVGELPHYFEASSLFFETPAFPDIASIPIYDACSSGKCTCVHLIGGVPAQLKPCRAAPYLFGPSFLDDISTENQTFLWRGLVKGFDIVDDQCPSSYYCENYNSILDDKFYSEMTDLLLAELSQFKVSKVDYKPRCVHSLGAVVKSNGKLRPITDCSRPDGVSINNFMETTFRAFTYNSVEDAVEILNANDFMAVVDITSAYRSVNVNPEQVDFQGFTWDFGSGPELLVDRRLCFGLRCAPNIFDSLSSLIVKIAHARGAQHVINYLDDFLIVAPTPEKCRIDRDIVVDTIKLLGYEVSWKKVTEPSPVTTFLGITIDSQKMELSLPLAKVDKLKTLITETLSCGHASKKCLESLGGLMSHCSYVVRGGRTFSRRIFDLAASYSRHAKRIPLNRAVQADLDWWLAFCHIFNGQACIIKDLHPIPIVSDSSFMGFGAWAGLDWIAGFWDPATTPQDFPHGCSHVVDPPSFDKCGRNINVCELWPVVAGLHRWAPSYRNSRIHIITDNMQVLAMINTGRSTNKTCMTWLRELFWICVVNNIDLFASYIKSEDNILADALSRAAYSGVTQKCVKLLDGFNMCCSSPSRTILQEPEVAPADPPTGSMGRLDPDSKELSDEML